MWWQGAGLGVIDGQRAELGGDKAGAERDWEAFFFILIVTFIFGAVESTDHAYERESTY